FSDIVRNSMWNYQNRSIIDEQVSLGRHREIVGGLWEEMGSLQIEFLISFGLTPEDTLLDIGCGCFRLGTKAIDYLNAGNYWALDVNQSLVDAGYKRELVPLGLDKKLPIGNISINDTFDLDFISAKINYIIAHNTFCCLPFNSIRRCLSNIASCFSPPFVLFASFHLVRRDMVFGDVENLATDCITYPDRPLFHYSEDDLKYAIRGLPIRYEIVGDWGHPTGMIMVAFRPRIWY
ncbi:MAG: class I SAM-dependent methyltransferase, partial [Bacteroidota bacterium]